MVKGRLKHKTGSRRLWILFETGGRKGPKQARQNYVNILETIQTSPNHTFLGFYPEEKHIKFQPFPMTALKTKLSTKEHRSSSESQMIIDSLMLLTSSSVSVQTFLWKLKVCLLGKEKSTELQRNVADGLTKPARSIKTFAEYFLI